MGLLIVIPSIHCTYQPRFSRLHHGFVLRYESQFLVVPPLFAASKVKPFLASPAAPPGPFLAPAAADPHQRSEVNAILLSPAAGRNVNIG